MIVGFGLWSYCYLVGVLIVLLLVFAYLFPGFTLLYRSKEVYISLSEIEFVVPEGEGQYLTMRRLKKG